MQSNHVFHTLAPWYTPSSTVLILGSLPSPKSRQLSCYYGHPQNRFWKVLSTLTGDECGTSPIQRRAFCDRHGIALWDVISECDIAGASDASIKNSVPNPIEDIISKAPIQAVFTTGKKAHALYQKHLLPRCHIQDICLPSTSAANCATKMEDLLTAYAAILPYLK